MGLIFKLVSLSVIGLAIYIGFLKKPAVLPKEYREDHYWGTAEVKAGQKLPKDNEAIKPFKIDVPQTVLDDLQQRLKNTRYIKSLQGTNFEYGFRDEILKTVVDHWINKYNWRTHEKQLNQYKHFKTQIEGIDVHFIHVKPTAAAGVKVVPLMMVHGWPGSVVEYLKMIPLLTKPVDGLAFELIIPSIPGYGWSEAPHKPGFETLHAARIFAKLMDRLGHQKFYYQGGDWGSFIGKSMGMLYPEKLLGLSVSMTMVRRSIHNFAKIFIGAYAPRLVFEDPINDPKFIYPYFEKNFWMILRETGYLHVHATKPDTIGASLSDSPAGLAAWILEKFIYWVNPANHDTPTGKLTDKFTMDELLTNVMVYWLTNTGASSARLYKEQIANYKLSFEIRYEDIPIPPSVPIGVTAFPYELLAYPKNFITDIYQNVTRFTRMPRGGHFSAFEEPQLLADEVRAFIKPLVK